MLLSVKFSTSDRKMIIGKTLLKYMGIYLPG